MDRAPLPIGMRARCHRASPRSACAGGRWRIRSNSHLDFGPIPQMSSFRRAGVLRSVAMLVLAGFLVTGCATQGATSNSAIDRANQNFAATVATGTVAGAAVGAIVGAIFGGKNGALLGAAAGGALGTGAGYLVASNNASQAAEEDTLEGQIKSAEQRASDANAAAAEARQVAARAQAESQALLAAYRTGGANTAEYRRRIGETQQTAKSIQQLLANLQTEETRLRQQIAAAGTGGAPLQASLVSIESSRRDLQASLDRITTATSQVPQS
jgi:hypothetical protein